MISSLTSSRMILRHASNPILSAKDVSYPATLIFNAGVTKYQGRYVMVFRNDVGTVGEMRFSTTNLGIAWSTDGIAWNVEPKPFLTAEQAVELAASLYGSKVEKYRIHRAYDPRLTVIDGELYMCFALDCRYGVLGGVARIHDMSKMELLSLSVPDNRNMVLFSERRDGNYMRLERPFPVYSRGRDQFDVWYSESPDLRYWGNQQLVLGVEDVPFANDKVGPGAPPIKTDYGWLTAFHAVDIDESRGKNGWEPRWKKRYTAGLMLLDITEPHKVLSVYQEPLLAPEAPYETSGGFRNDVVFPGGMILEDTGEVKIYYGAADTVECLATADIGDLLDLVISSGR